MRRTDGFRGEIVLVLETRNEVLACSPPGHQDTKYTKNTMLASTPSNRPRPAVAGRVVPSGQLILLRKEKRDRQEGLSSCCFVSWCLGG